jgi:hypothetical protein
LSFELQITSEDFPPSGYARSCNKRSAVCFYLLVYGICSGRRSICRLRPYPIASPLPIAQDSTLYLSIVQRPSRTLAALLFRFWQRTTQTSIQRNFACAKKQRSVLDRSIGRKRASVITANINRSDSGSSSTNGTGHCILRRFTAIPCVQVALLLSRDTNCLPW